jgi:Holliday junction DNA helicase RuvA
MRAEAYTPPVLESIQGRLASKEPGRVVVEAGGLGYLVHVPVSDHDALPVVGRDVRLLLHLEVREDLWRLFGFARAEDREAFRRLLTVKGVGPTTAMTILSGIGVADLVAAVAAEDVRTLTRVKGIGRKTADLIVAELKDDAKRGRLGTPPSRGAAGAGVGDDAVRALVALGMDAAEARQRLERTAASLPAAAGVAARVRAALRG